MNPNTAQLPDLTTLSNGIAKFAIISVAVIASSCTGLRPVESLPRRTVCLKWRETFRTAQTHSLLIGGLPSRTLGLMEQRGLRISAHGDVATLALLFTYETTESYTTYSSYPKYIFKDGSALMALSERAVASPGHLKVNLAFLDDPGHFLWIKDEAALAAVTITPGAESGDKDIDAAGEYILLQTVTPLPAINTESHERRQNHTIVESEPSHHRQAWFAASLPGIKES